MEGDDFWGVGFASKPNLGVTPNLETRLKDVESWGKNHYGKILIELRSTLTAEKGVNLTISKYGAPIQQPAKQSQEQLESLEHVEQQNPASKPPVEIPVKSLETGESSEALTVPKIPLEPLNKAEEHPSDENPLDIGDEDLIDYSDDDLPAK